MAIKTISLIGNTSDDIASDAKKIFSGFKPKLLLFFASDIYDSTTPALKLQEAFPAASIIGATSHSEYCGSTFKEGTVVIMAIDEESVSDVCVKVIKSIKDHPDFSEDVKEMHDYFGGYENIFSNFDHYAGIVLFEGKSKAEEYCMDKLGTSTDILFVGGTSSTFKNDISRVYIGSESFEDAMVLAILKTVKGYDVVKTQSAAIFSEKSYTVTKSDMKTRTLYELDNKPVANVYASVLNIDKKDISDYFASNPLGVLADGALFVRTFNEQIDDGIILYCGIPEGTEIYVLKIGDIISDTKNDLDKIITYEPAGIINFNCFHRTFEILDKNLVEPYCNIFGKYKNIGFSTAGEAFLGHMNETSTILVIK